MTSPEFHPHARVSRRCLGLTLLLAASFTRLTAQDRLTPASLTAWKTSGPVPIFDASSGATTVPAGGQLVRTYTEDRVTVRLASRPYFQAKSPNWPALEVGPAALTFVQDKSGGGMVLLGDQILTLSQAIALGTDGRSERQLDLSLVYDRGLNLATLVVDGASYALTATADGQGIAVAVSAGGEANWALNILEVSRGVSAAAADGKSGANGLSAKQAVTSAPILGPLDGAARQQTFISAIFLAAAGDITGAENALTGLSHYPPNTAGWELDLANNLVWVAFRLREQGNSDNTTKVIQAALGHVDSCVRLASNPEGGIAGSALELAGMVNAQFMGDLVSAEAAYRKGLGIKPDLDSAQSALTRLLGARDSEQKKLKAWGHK